MAEVVRRSLLNRTEVLEGEVKLSSLSRIMALVVEDSEETASTTMFLTTTVLTITALITMEVANSVAFEIVDFD